MGIVKCYVTLHALISIAELILYHVYLSADVIVRNQSNVVHPIIWPGVVDSHILGDYFVTVAKEPVVPYLSSRMFVHVHYFMFIGYSCNGEGREGVKCVSGYDHRSIFAYTTYQRFIPFVGLYLNKNCKCANDTVCTAFTLTQVGLDYTELGDDPEVDSS